MYKILLAPNVKGISEILVNYDNVSEMKQTAEISYAEVIDISKIVDKARFPQAEGISQINKIWRAEGQLFDDWYNEPDTLLVEYLLENLGLDFTSIQKVDPQSGQFVTFKTNE
ncbi:hypothetical protein GOQ04_25400 [Emticicia sp. ODNR4P]|nr:hypothetical protein [Emticicia sp. ODNR4P]